MTDVVRVSIGRSPAGAELEDAEGLETISLPSLAELRDAAESAPTSLLWLLDARAVPGPDTLQVLLDAGRTPAVSLPVDPAGVPVDRLIGRFLDTDHEAVLAAVRDRQVPIRHTHVVSMLVEGRMVLELAPPDPGRFAGYAGTEWAARLVARHGGTLVPQSRVGVAGAPKPALLPVLRLAGTGTWRRREILREALLALRG